MYNQQMIMCESNPTHLITQSLPNQNPSLTHSNLNLMMMYDDVDELAPIGGMGYYNEF